MGKHVVLVANQECECGCGRVFDVTTRRRGPRPATIEADRNAARLIAYQQAMGARVR